MNGSLVITVGETVTDSNQRTLDTVRRVRAGETISVDTRINFSSWNQLFSMLNANRMGVLNYVHMHEPKSINSIATGLSRSYRRVHEDVQKLLDLGLIDRQEDGSLSVGYNPNAAAIREVAA